MVRIIVGTIVDVSRKKLKISDIDEMFKSLDRQKAGKTMPARGLCLKDVDYNI